MTDDPQDPLSKLPRRKQRKYVENLARGMSKRKAALAAGYSQSSARNPAQNIERGRVREVFAELIRGSIPGDLIAMRIREGLDAQETKVFNDEGAIIYSDPLVAWTERRQYAELAAKFGGYYVEKQAIELADQGDDLPEEKVMEKMEKLMAAMKRGK